MKKVLNLVLSADFAPYDALFEASKKTWDSIKVDGVETVYYFGKSDKENTNTEIYFPVEEALNTMGHKLLQAFEWALNNKEFDYLARPHSCIYVDKKELIKYVQTLPETNVFGGLKVVDTIPWNWGGCGFILSRDVVEKVIINKSDYDHTKMEDMGLSYLINKLEIPYTQGKGCSIDNMGGTWRCMIYGGGAGFEFTDFEDLKKVDNQYFYRIKQDGKRWVDLFLMNELFRVLN